MLTLAEAASLRHQIANGKLWARKVGPVWTAARAAVERYRRESLGKPGRH